MDTTQTEFKLNIFSKDNFTNFSHGIEYVNFGLKGDKFAKFMVEMCAEFNVKANFDAKVYLHNIIMKYKLLCPIYSGMFESHWKNGTYISSAYMAVKNLNDKLFKLESGEVCMLLDSKYRDRYHLADNNKLVNNVANALHRLVCLNATYDYLNAKIQTIDVTKNPRDYVCVTIGNSTYKFKIGYTPTRVSEAIQGNPNRNNFTGKDCDCFMIGESCKKPLQYILLGHKDHPYKKIIKEEAEKYWNPQSTKRFFHTSFTCRDVYLIFLLLTGASKKVILKNYSEDEIREMVGNDKTVINEELFKAAYNELDEFTKDFYSDAKRSLDAIEAEFHRKLAEVKKARIAELLAKLNTLNNEYIDKIKELTPDIEGFSYPNKFMSAYGSWIDNLKRVDYDLL